MAQIRFATFGVFLLAAVAANAQVEGRLSGTVVDASGAGVPGGIINIYIPAGKQPVMRGKTNDAGNFVFIAMRPATYDVAVEVKGFNRLVLHEVKIDPARETGLGTIKLEVQSTVQTVDVTSDVQAVQLTNAEISSTITSVQVENLPLLGRQVQSLFATQVGVNATNDTTSINGTRSSFTNLTLDGINIQDNYIRTNALDYQPMRTTIDQIAEITVVSSNQGPTIGGGASQIVMSSRSGSNTYHGAFYWFNRNSALAANDWFNNQSGIKIPHLDLNQVGASAGGRIIRDKLFFYINYELYRDREQSSRLRTVLLDSAKSGIFTYRDSGGGLHQTNLLTLRNIKIDPIIQAMLGQLPAPNSSGAGDGLNTGAYRFNARSNEFRDQLVYRMDYYLSPKHSISGTHNYISNPTDRPDAGNFFTTVPPVSNSLHSHLARASWRWTASSTFTNEVLVGFFRNHGDFLDSNKYPNVLVGGLIFSSPTNFFLDQGRTSDQYSIQDNASWIHGKHTFQFGFQTSLTRIAPFNDGGIVPTYNLGISAKNTSGLAASDLPGINVANLATANSLYASLGGIVSNASQTFNVTSPTSGYVPGATNLRHFGYDTWAGYFHDNWKVLPHLTLALGLRYEIWTPLVEANSLFLTPRLENHNVIQTLLDPYAVLDFSGGPGHALYQTDKNNFAPNIGLAWDPFGSGRTSIRAGYTISYAQDNLVTTIANSGGTAAGLSAISAPTNLVGVLSSPPPIPLAAYQIPRTLLDNYNLNSAAAVAMPNPDLVTPYVQQWTLGIQHEFKNTIFELRYVGNHGTKLIRGFDYNQVLYNQNGFLADFRRAQNNAILSKGKSGAYDPTIPGSQQLTVFPTLPLGGSLDNATILTELQQGQVGDLANLYQQFGYTSGPDLSGPFSFFTNPYVLGANALANGGNSSYHALQAEIRRRTRAGLQYQFGYAFGKALSNTTGDNQTNFEPLLDNNSPNLEKARSPYDITHSFKANFYYEMPYGPGKRWSGGKVMNHVLGGWAVSGIWSYISGEPFSVISGLGTLNRAARSATTNTASVNGTTLGALNNVTSGVYMTGNGPYFISPSVINPQDGRGAEFDRTFADEVFFNPSAGSVGNLQRRLFTGPWQWSWDMSVKKQFRLHERHTLDLHFDFFDFMNHPTFYIRPTTGGDYGSVTNFNINNTTFGRITSMNYNPRVIQIAAYYRF